MNHDFEAKVHGAGVAGWWTVVASAAVLALQWVAYLIVMSSRPAWLLSLWGSATWPEVQHLWLLATVLFKGFVAVLAILCLWLTLWARELRRAAGASGPTAA